MWRDVLAIAALHALACTVARLAGFDHVSDDDFARVTIAQAFVHAPKLDPSGTSWLPFPFWLLGGAMLVVGRSLAAARALSILFASLAATLPYVALRHGGAPRSRALVATAFAFGSPWAVWLGAATVPESITASLCAAGALGITTAIAEDAGTARATGLLGAAAIATACLARYEAWPAAGVLAIACAIHAFRLRRAQGAQGRLSGFALALTLACAAAPLAWMAWNAYAHDGPLHFFRRVSSFKRAIGEGATDTLSALALYPRLLVTTRPEVTLPAILLALPALRDSATRRRWLVPLATALAQVAFLAYGNARDGSAAHHPERALLAAELVLALFVADAGLVVGGRLLAPKRAFLAGGAVGALWLASLVRGLADVPGGTPAEDRRAQIARGDELRRAGAAEIVVRPCAFEHFALLAAFAAPERARIEPRTDPPGEATISPACPRVDVVHPDS